MPSKYPCYPTPFQTMFGVVMICKKCGHYAPPECKTNKWLQPETYLPKGDEDA